jgi:hypothetical protein
MMESVPDLIPLRTGHVWAVVQPIQARPIGIQPGLHRDSTALVVEDGESGLVDQALERDRE